MIKKKLTQERLKHLLQYDLETGLFVRRIDIKRGGIMTGTPAGCRFTQGNKAYYAARIDGQLYPCHRLAWLYVYGEFPKGVIDHINRDGLDNRIENLRDVTHQVNMQNVSSKKDWKLHGCNLTGVSWDKSTQSWKSSICINGKQKHLGRFKTQESAHEAYLIKKREIHVGCTI